jgi:TolB-like protein/DNA-binding winged helix-turn-helix (wHTH) protein/Tfp pilus assembly protein PilF
MTGADPVKRVPHLGTFRVGEWSVRQAEGTLGAKGRLLRLEPRVMDVLVFLAAAPGQVVSKEELLEVVWAGSFVEEGVLSQAVHNLRKALGDNARQPSYIQTIPKRGYRLLAPVAPAEPGEMTVAPPPGLGTLGVPSPWWRSRRTRFLLPLFGIMATIIGWQALRRAGMERTRSAETSRASHGIRIVVLPFEDLGKPQGENASFAEGLTEEITKDMALVPALQVISRTSAMHYLGVRKPLPEIGRELGVDFVLEGTVRWALGPEGKARVRITPQLIRVADDVHIWADSFERQVEDIFQVQAEISRRVIGRLGIALLPDAERAPLAPPTENLEAYWAYVRGIRLMDQPYYSEQHLREAVPMFERAVKLDPGFTAAWAALSQTQSYLAFNSDPSPAQAAKARAALERAVALDPRLPEVRVAEAYYTYRCLEDYAAAHRQLATAAKDFPNDAEVQESLGLVLRRLGRLAEAVDVFQHAFALNPHAVKLLFWIAETSRALRDYQQADSYFAQAISKVPDQAEYWAERALNRLAWKGDGEKARAVLDEAPVPQDPKLAAAAFQIDLDEREYARALGLTLPDTMRELPPQPASRMAVLAVTARERMGDRTGAVAAAEANRRLLEQRVKRFPNEAFYRAYLAVSLAQLGRGPEALAQAEQAVQQVHADAFSGPRIIELQAMTEAILGRSVAIDRLAHLVATPYQSPISAADLRLDPVWDPLRRDPAFQALLGRVRD